NGRQPPCQRRSLEASLRERGQIVAKVIAARRRDTASRRTQMRGEVVDIAPVGGKRVGGSAAFGGEHVQEQLREPGVGRGRRSDHGPTDSARLDRKSVV